MTKPVALILGAGPRIGSAVATTFSQSGYSIALASRRGTNSIDPSTGHLSLPVDLTNPASIPALFSAVRAHFHTSPSVVIYNAAALTPPPDPTSALSIPLDRVVSDLNVNTVTAYAAAQEAVRAWADLPADAKKSFIYTGNILNTTIMPVGLYLNLGVGKSASAFWIGLADATYSEKGYRFFYADERAADGNSKGNDIDGPAHADFFKQLADHADVPWHATFVKGKGYTKF